MILLGALVNGLEAAAGGIIGLIGLVFSPFVSKLDRVLVDLV